MITVNSAPIANRVLLDGNSTLISITSSNGVGHYFRARIFIDDVLFDEQSWSRSDNFTAVKNLKKLYNAYFETVFNPVFTNQLTEQTHLKKKVSITIIEKTLATNALVQTAVLPDYYILYNQNPVAFDDAAKIQLLGISPEILLTAQSGKIAIPFFANATAEDVLVTLKDNFGTILNTQTVALVTGAKCYLYNFNLAGITLSNNVTHFVLSFAVGTTILTKIIKLILFPDYELKEIAFLSNFGFYMHTYFDGTLQIDAQLEIQSYEQLDGSEKVFEISEGETYAINTGSLLRKESQILENITAALDAKLFFKNEWLTMVSKNKKYLKYKDRIHNYGETLSFSVTKNRTISNVGLAAIPQEVVVVYQVVIDSVLIPVESPAVARLIINNNGTATDTGYTIKYYHQDTPSTIISVPAFQSVEIPVIGTYVYDITVTLNGRWYFWLEKGTYISDVNFEDFLIN